MHSAICVLFTLLFVCLSSDVYTVSQSLNDFHDSDDHRVDPVCEAFAAVFADAAANYTKCFVVNSRPMFLCTKCIEEYLAVNSAYAELEQVVDMKSFNGRPYHRACTDWILNADRIMAIQQTKQFFEDLWSTSNCPNCFEEYSWKENHTDYQIALHVEKFMQKANVTAACFANFTNGRIPVNSTQNETQPHPCYVCNLSYHALNSYYLQLDDKYSTKLCMDIVDSMNYTRLTWGHQFNCSGNTRQDGITITITVLFLMLPPVFYIASHIHYQKLESKIVTQNRMRMRRKSGRTRHTSSDRPPTPHSAEMSAVGLMSSATHSAMGSN